MNTNTENNTDLNPEVKPAAKEKRKYKKFLVEFPINREFSALSLAQELECEVYSVNNAIKRMKDKIKVVGHAASPRGRKKRVYKLI